MARTRVFISSTYYDLKHIRSSLELFIESLGFDPILSEKGDIAYSPDSPLDESCYREVGNSDIFVLIIGGRYGSPSSTDRDVDLSSFHQRYDSVTQKEYKEAVDNDIPIYILIESSVYAEYKTYQRNKSKTSISYAHVDSANIFVMIEEILAKPRNNPVHTFERSSDIETWLREQWSGLFREFLNKSSEQRQISELSVQIEGLREVNKTLKTYLEAVMKGVSHEKSAEIIKSEERRLQDQLANENSFVRYVNRMCDIDRDLIVSIIKKSTDFNDFIERITNVSSKSIDKIRKTITESSLARRDFNDVRKIFKLKSFKLLKATSDSSSESTDDDLLEQDIAAARSKAKKTTTKSKKRNKEEPQISNDKE